MINWYHMRKGNEAFFLICNENHLKNYTDYAIQKVNSPYQSIKGVPNDIIL